MVVRVKTDCADCLNHEDLTPGNVYRVLSREYDYIRLMSDVGRPGLYPVRFFDFVSMFIPPDWVSRNDYEGNLSYFGPEAIGQPGFYEDYFDGKRYAIQAAGIRLAKWRRGEDYTVNDLCLLSEHVTEVLAVSES